MAGIISDFQKYGAHMARIKTNGAELKRFWANTDAQFWPENSYVDEMCWQVNGEDMEDVDVENLADTDLVTVEGYILCGETPKDLAGVMKKWRKLESNVTLAVEVPAEQVEALKTFLKSLKGRIIGI